MQFFLALFVGLVLGFTLSFIALSSGFIITISNWNFYNKITEPTMEVGTHSKDEGFHKMENSTVADALYKKVRLLCWIMTYPETHKEKARHVKATWGKRCNILLFMSTEEDESLPTVALNVSEGRNNLWGKTKEAHKYLYKNYLDKADWFLKADDDTYVIVENLRYMLLKHNASEPIYFGCKFKPIVRKGYMSGGAGYVLSRKSVEKFVEVSLRNATICRADNDGSEDVEIGKCLVAVQVTAGDSRDAMGRGRFFPLNIETQLIPGLTPEWFFRYIYYQRKLGMKCCSDSAISFHYIKPNDMYVLEYLIYHLRPFGVSLNFEMPPELIKTSTAGIKNGTRNREIFPQLVNILSIPSVRNTNTIT